MAKYYGREPMEIASLSKTREQYRNLHFSFDPANLKTYSGTGTVANDMTGKYSTTLVNAPTWTGKSFSLDGVNDHIAMQQTDLNKILSYSGNTRPLTIEMWVRKSGSWLGGETYPLMSVATTSTNKDIQLYFATSTLNCIFRGTVGDYVHNFNILPNDRLSKWNHIVVVLSNVITTYINGVSAGNIAYSGQSSANNSAQLVIGRHTTTGGVNSYWPGEIGMVNIWRPYAFTATQVLQRYNYTKDRYI